MITYVVVQNLWLEGTRNQGLAHEETIEVHRSSPHSRLRKLENHARLEDKIDTFATNRFLFIGRQHGLPGSVGLFDDVLCRGIERNAAQARKTRQDD